MELNALRSQINEVDDALIKLFLKRMELSGKVAVYKHEKKLPIYVPEREQEILDAVSEKTGTDMSPYLRELYATIFELSRRYQMQCNAASNDE